PPRWYCSPPHRHGGALATDRCAADAEKTLAYKALCLIPRTGPLAGVCLQSLRGDSHRRRSGCGTAPPEPAPCAGLVAVAARPPSRRAGGRRRTRRRPRGLPRGLGEHRHPVGAGWLADVSATPLVTRISQSGSSLRWFVARLATTGTFDGILVGALEASQVANLLGSVDPGATATERVDVVLPGRLLLYSSAMTSTLHAGLTDASMIADGALSTRVVSPAVTAALAGGTGVASYSTNGVSTVAGYDSISLPGWEMGVVVTEPSVVAAAAGQGLPGPAWLLPSVALAVGLLLLLALADPRRTRAIVAPDGRLRQAGTALTPMRLRSGARGAGSGGAAIAVPPAAALGEAGPTLAHDSSPVADTPPSRRRRLRGRYEILEVVGSGGEGQVLRALDHLHARQVAIKVRHLDPHDISRRRDILNEASVLLRMTPDPHASVVREDFILGDRYYLVMDWIDGTPLDRLLGERGDPGLPWAAVLDWMGQVAEVLDHLHRQTPPIVHGDVKPG